MSLHCTSVCQNCASHFGNVVAKILVAFGKAVAYHRGMNIERIRQLVAATPLKEVAKASGIPLRTLYRFHNQQNDPRGATLALLEKWAKGRRLPVQHRQPKD